MVLPPHSPINYGFRPQHNDPPPEVSGGSFTPSFDERLWMFHRRWEPKEKVHATLMIFHGTVDHSGVYAELAEKLALAGVAVFAMDMRGWGLSDGERMYLDSMGTFVSDVDALYQHIHSTPPYDQVSERFLLGKSLGGTVTAYAAAKFPRHWTGLLGLSGAYQLDPKLIPSALQFMIVKGLAMIAPKMPFKALFDEHLIVSDEDALQKWREDALCCKEKIRVGYGLVFINSLREELPETIIPQINLPMLMMCGDEDHVVTLSGHHLMVQKSQPNEDKQVRTYTGGYHNLLQEPALKDQVMEDIQKWILDKSKKT